jgi:ubiquitin C-terminal hydrolase
MNDDIIEFNKDNSLDISEHFNNNEKLRVNNNENNYILNKRNNILDYNQDNPNSNDIINNIKIEYSLIGLNNLDNNCYLNCGLQALIHSKTFINYLI